MPAFDGSMAMQALGGLGLFLLGMIIMTDGLRALAGERLHHVLTRFTRSPASGALTGALSTALLQSSSATTVAAVGFVGAGLLTFPQALGIVFGANLGTTLTGWLVVLLGFKLELGAIALPLVLIGAVLRLFGRSRLAQGGLALAGFALIFLGIAQMQAGMAGLQGVVTPHDFPADTLAGRLQLVAIGIAITLVTQSSSAGVAAALTALFAGAINFHQAASLVIGMDIGTTATAALATLGGGVETRRTGFSHVVYNLITGVAALMLLDPYTALWGLLAPGALADHAELALVGFHSSFNLLGIVLLLPFAAHFTGLIERLFPATASPLTQALDPTLLREPDIALTAAQAALRQMFLALLAMARRLPLAASTPAWRETMQAALDDTRRFIDAIHIGGDDATGSASGGASGPAPGWERLLNLIHALDHLERLRDRCVEDHDRAALARRLPELDAAVAELDHVLGAVAEAITAGDAAAAATIAQRHFARTDRLAEQRRAELMARVAHGELSVAEGTNGGEAVRWLLRSAAHVARVSRHLAAPSASGRLPPIETQATGPQPP